LSTLRPADSYAKPSLLDLEANENSAKIKQAYEKALGTKVDNYPELDPGLYMMMFKELQAKP
jgi:hypothetical protein